MSIYEKLGQIQKTLKAPKNQRNKFGGYNYRSCEDKVPIPPHLVEEVLSKKGYIIADRFGKFDVQRFSRYFKKIRDILGFDERYIFKNMRHTGSTAYVEAGVATNAIISITGHTNEAIFNQVYKGNTEEVTLPALKKRLEAESRNNKIKESE